jgi:tripartite-type tricarboxylate transporter receptor subunit TctC
LDKEMKFLATLLLFVSTALFAGQPVEIVVPYPAGGATDKLARIVEEIFNEHGIKSYVTNKAGADGVIGGNYAAKARPDGKTVS